MTIEYIYIVQGSCEEEIQLHDRDEKDKDNFFFFFARKKIRNCSLSQPKWIGTVTCHQKIKFRQWNSRERKKR